MIKEKDKEVIFFLKKIKYLLENGLMIVQKQEFILKWMTLIHQNPKGKFKKIY